MHCKILGYLLSQSEYFAFSLRRSQLFPAAEKQVEGFAVAVAHGQGFAGYLHRAAPSPLTTAKVLAGAAGLPCNRPTARRCRPAAPRARRVPNATHPASLYLQAQLFKAIIKAFTDTLNQVIDKWSKLHQTPSIFAFGMAFG
jgi:hypothetical protein